MRKSFTLLFSTLILLCVFGYSSFAVAPVLAATNPLAPTGVNVNPTTANLVVKFDQNIKFTSTGGTLWIRKGDNVVKTIALEQGSANASISGSTLTVKHGLTFADGENYSVGINNNAIENTAGEDFAGITNTIVGDPAVRTYDWMFTIGDYTKPVVASLNPADGETNVDVKDDPFQLEITFTDANDIEAVDGKKVWLYRADGTIVDIVTTSDANTSIGEDGKTASILISQNAFRDELTEYYVNIEAGAFTDASDNTNAFAGIMNNTAWTFTSRDYTAPFVSEATVDNISYETATLNVTISEAGSVWYIVLPASDDEPAHPTDDATGWEQVDADASNAISEAISGLDDGVAYIVYIVAENADGDRQTEASKIPFTTLDNTLPEIIDGSNVQVVEDNVTVGLELTFNEEVVAGTGDLVVRLASNNQAERTVAASSENISITEGDTEGTWVMTVLFEGLPSSVNYYVVVPNGYVEDLAGNDYVSDFVDTNDWTITSNDFVAPTVAVSIVPAASPGPDDNIRVVFNEAVQLVDGTAMSGLSDQADWFNYLALEQNNQAVPFTASYSGTTIIIDPVALMANTIYTVKIRANAFEDLAGNAFSSTHKSYMVTTSDFGAATITYSPADGAIDLPQGTEPTITFSKNVRLINNDAITPANIKSAITFKETDASGANVAFSVSWNEDTNVITVVPDEELESEGTYYLSFNEAVVEDVNNQLYTDPGSTTFTLIDYVPPTVSFSHSGTVDDMDANDPLTLTFSEDVTIVGDVEDYVIFRQDGADGAALEFSADWDVADDKVIIVTPADPLEDGMVYYYGIGGGVASDNVNTNSAAFSTFTFAPADEPVTGLLVAEDGYDPAVGATNVDMSEDDFVATITFAEAAKAAPGLPALTVATLYDASDDSQVATAPIDALSFEGSVLTLTFDISGATIASEGDYYIVVPADVAVANANNTKSFSGVAADDWTFTSADNIDPEIEVNTPVDGAINVALDAEVSVNVDEEVVAGTGDITFITGSPTPGITLGNGLVALWDLEEASGNAIDSQGSNDGTVAGGITTGQESVSTELGNSYLFAPTDPKVDVGYSAELADYASGFSIGFWIKPQAPQTGVYNAILRGAGGNGNTRGWRINSDAWNGGSIRFASGNETTGANPNVMISNLSSLWGSWIYVAATYDGSTVNLYVNGTEYTASGTNITINAASPASDWHMLLGESGGTADYAGNMDQVAYYNRVLSSKEINELYNSGNGFPSEDFGTEEFSSGEEITVAVADASISEGVITIPHDDFSFFNSEYTVTVPAGAFVDGSGNPTNELSWTFTTVTNPAPTIVALTPEDDEDMIAAGTNQFMIEFSEDVQKGASGATAFLFEVGEGNSRAALAGNGTAVANDDIQRGAILVDNANDVMIDGTEVTLDFGYALEADKEYFILVESGMFEDTYQPNNANFVNTVNVYGGWNFYTYDATAPTWEVTYDVLGEGMNINSDIVITFNKPVDFNNAAITNAQITNIVNVTVGGSALAFTGTISEDKTVITLDNSSFVPALTEANSGDEVVVTLDAGFRGVGNDLAVTATVDPFNIADYEAPSVTLTEESVAGDEFEVAISADDKGTLYWIFQEGTISGSVTAEDVMAGTVIEDYESGDVVITVAGVNSETTYTVYAVAVDENNNVSDVASLEVTTADVTAPVVVEKSDTFTEGGVLTLTFSEDVSANGAEAIIREAGTFKLVETVSLEDGAESDELTLTSSAVLAYDDDQEFIIEVEGGVVTDGATPVNYWAGQIGLGDNAWIVGLPDRTRPILLTVEPDVDAPVALNAVWTFTFDEEIQLAENYEFGIYQVVGTVTEPFETLDASRISIDGNVLTIDPSRNFQPSSRYEIFFTSGDVEDLAGNAFKWENSPGSFVNYYSKRFNTVGPVDNEAPTVTFAPANGATDVSEATPTLTITFNEPVVLRDGSEIDYFDLDTVVYVRKGNEDVAHETTIDAAAQVITITLDGSELPLELGAQYTYGFEAVFMDAAENNVSAGSATFTVETEEVIDTYISFDPDNGFDADPTVIPVDQAIRIIFNGELFTYSGTASENNIAVTPTYLEDVDVIELEEVEGATVPFSASIERRDQDTTIIVITPDADLDSETEYVLTVKANMLQLGVGNVRILTRSDWNDYMTEDVLAPVAEAFNPADDGTANTAATMSIEFNEPVKIGTGTIEIKHSYGEVALTVDASALEVDENNPKLVYITELADLEVGSEYFVIIPAGTITDLADNAWGGITVEDDWNFTITDVPAAPVIVSVAPRGGNTPINTQLVITFDRPVVLNETMGFIALYDADGVALELIRVNDESADRITFNADKTQAVVSIGVLEENSQYEAEISEGTFVLETDATLGNAAVTRSFWTFTTEINDVPELQELTPADDAENVRMRTVASMVFDINVQAGTGTIDLRRGDNASLVHSFDVNSSEVVFDGNEVSFDLEGIIEGNTTDYYIIVPEGAITNISQTPESFPGLEQTYEWNFTTGEDFVLPELVTWSPDEVELPANHPTFVMNFSEDVVLANPGNLVVTKVGSTQPALVIPLAEEMITGSTITVSYDEATYGTLEYESDYYVTVAANLIEDLSENPWGGVTDKTTWTFSTKDRNVTIADIQGTGSSSQMVDVYVRVTGTVTGISVGEGFFMQDANEAWSGLWVEYGDAASLTVGEGVVVIGDVAEISEVTTVVAESVETTDAALTVEPILLDSPSVAKAEMYESVLVQVLDARASAANANKIWNIAYDGAGNIDVSSRLFTYTPVEGHLYDVTGIVNGRMSNYRMEPRMESDIIHYQPIADIQGTGSASPQVGDEVHVNATVTAISTGEGFYMQDASAAWSGIWVEYPDAASLTIGQGVKVVGDVSEISEVTTIVATDVQMIDAPATIVPVVVDSPSAAETEMYESVLVQVKGARANAANTAGTWSVYYQIQDNVNISSRLYTYTPVADHFYDVAGVVNARMGNYRMDPRMAEDIYDITLNTGVPEVSAVDFKVYPNPFSDNINIDNNDRLNRVIITNIAGQRVMDVKYPERRISTANLVSGVYVISLFNEDGMVKSDRIVKR